MTLTVDDAKDVLGFSHEVAFYEGASGLVPALVPFLREGIDRDEPVLVVMLPDRIRLLRAALGDAAEQVAWGDMGSVGGNPACIIPAWRDFLDAHRGQGPVRGIGEPVWAGRRDAEIAEAQLHESLLNLAFDSGPDWRLLCPYDVDSLPAAVVEEAFRNHPVRHVQRDSVPYAGHEHAWQGFSHRLPEPPVDASTLAFEGTDLGTVRAVVRRACEAARLHPSVTDDLVLAAHEVAANSVLHAQGGGVLRIWDEAGALAVEVWDDGRIHDPLVGRTPLDLTSEHGRGIWMANQLCDLVQVRSGDHGTQVRLYSWL
ncbi:MAG: sensor histidine kinase [Nocardioides sp.]